MDLNLYNAERFVESLEGFKRAVEERMVGDWKVVLYDQNALIQLNEQLDILTDLATDYLNKLRADDFLAKLTVVRIRNLATVFDEMYKNDTTDTYYVLNPHFITLQSIVVGLGRR